MEISENSRLYLANYYVLDQTRNETHKFLENIAVNFANLVNEHIKMQDRKPFIFKKHVQKDGGRVEIFLNVLSVPEKLAYLGDEIKFSLVYVDAIRSNEMTSPTKCIILGYSSKNNSKLVSEVGRISKLRNIKNPYEKIEIELIDNPVDDVINKIAKEFVTRHDNFIDILEILTKEQSVK